jgi:hypothetical protein
MKENSLDKNEVLGLGFNIIKLPSGRLNLCHSDRFSVNGFTTICKKDGQWFKTFELVNEEQLFSQIKSLEFME